MDGGVLAGRFLDREDAAGRDFGGLTFRSTMPVVSSEQSGNAIGVTDLVKREVTSRFQVLIQLESLILAQSERWRQA